MRKRIACLATVLLLVVAAPSPLAADDGLAGAGLPDEWQLIVDRGRTALLTTGTITADGVTRHGWLLTSLQMDGNDWNPLEQRLVLATRRYVGAPAHADAVHLANGDWAIIGDVHGGGTRLLQYARLSRDILDSSAKTAPDKQVKPELIVEVSVRLDANGPRVRLQDLCTPQLLEHNDRVYAIGASRYVGKPQAGTTWIAEVKVTNRILSGRRICDGIDPRIVRHGSGFVCAVRKLRENQTLLDAAPVELYRSADLQTWTLLGQAAPRTAFYDYDLLSDGNTLWVLGVAGEGKPLGQLFKYTDRDNKWVRSDTRFDVTSKHTVVQFMPASATPNSPLSAVYNASRSFRRVQISRP